MRIILLLVTVTGLVGAAQSDQVADTRTERAKGYHIVKRPERTGATPEDVKIEKAEEDSTRRRKNTDISEQTGPSREPQLKPKQITP